jgi:hypothetical protein
MPIEIRELHIKAVIDTGGSNNKNAQANDTTKDAAGGTDQKPDNLVDLCVEKVLEILKEKEER